MPRIAPLLFLLLSGCFQAQSQQSISQLAQQLSAQNPTDSLKVRAIFDWITENIAYDVTLYQARKSVRYVSSEDHTQWGSQVLKSRRGVCSGYAHLFYTLGKAMGLRVEVVEGLGRVNSFFGDDPIKIEAHAWNAVKIKNHWYLVDATWAAGGVDEHETFRFNKNEKYYLTPPYLFLREHYPQDPLWQLSDTPISIEAFRQNRNETPIFSRFSYKDTLTRYENADSLTKKLASFQRTLLIDPHNITANHGLGYVVAQQAYQKMQAYTQLSAQLQAQKNPSQQMALALANKEKIFTTLNAIESTLKTALKYFEQVQQSEQFYENEQNVNASKNNLKQIQTERQRLSQYFANIERIKKR